MVHVTTEAGHEVILDLAAMRQVSVHSGAEQQIVRKEGDEELLAVTVPQEMKGDRCIKTSITTASGRPTLVEVTVPPELSAGASFHVRYKPEPSSPSRDPSSTSCPARQIGVPVVESDRGASELAPHFDPRIVVVKRGASFDTFDAALFPPLPPEAPPTALFSEEEMMRMDDDELLAVALQASQADAARLVAFPSVGGETSGQLSRRRRQILAEATPGTGISARVTFGEEATPRSSMHSPCPACNGLGKTSPFLSAPLAALVLRGAEQQAEYSCGVCFGDGEYKMSSCCGGAHYYCADCIRGSLTVRGAL